MKQNRMTAEEFTNAYPTGTPAKYWPRRAENSFIETTIRSNAWTLGHGAVVVNIDGVSGCVDVRHLVLPDPNEGVSAMLISDNGHVEHVGIADLGKEPPATIQVKGFRMQLPAGTRTGEVSDGYHTFDDLYAHRCRLFVALMRALPHQSFWSYRHSDGSAYEGWVLAGLMTGAGWVTYHLPENEVANLTMVREVERAPEWDGHTPDDVLERLLTLG